MFTVLYRRSLLLLLSVAVGIIFAIVIMILIDVGLRSIGEQPPSFTSALVEYGLLYATMCAAPWLLHKGGHVSVTSFISLLPARASGVIVRLSQVICICAGSIFTYYSIRLFASELSYGAIDVRSIEIPRYFLYAPLPIGFGLMTIEFLMRLFATPRGTSAATEISSEGL